MSYEAISERDDVDRGISIFDLSSSTGGENRLYEISIEKPEEILSHSVIQPEPVVVETGNIVNTGMAFPDLPFPRGTFHMIPNPNDPNPEPKGDNIENAITKMLNNSWLMIIGGSLILMIIICAFALIYYFKNQKKSGTVVYKFNS